MKIGLCLIVKNEAHVIERCLNSVRPLVDYFYVCDTGSTDGTPEVIRNWLFKNQLEGRVEEKQWVNFAHNRSEALSGLKELGVVDYCLMIDADEILVFKDKSALDSIQRFKKSLTCDLYNIQTVLGQCIYSRPQLTSTKKNFYYRAVVHEFLDCKDPITSRGSVEIFTNRPIQDSARNKSGDKFQQDAELLKNALSKETDPYLISRYTFYLAQSLRDSSNPREALMYYQKRAELKGWEEEVYVSLLSAGRLKNQLKYPIDDCIQSFLGACEVVHGRVEALYEAVKLCRNNGRNFQGFILGEFGLKIPEPKDGLFVERWIYEYGLLDELGLCAYYSGMKPLSARYFQRLLSEGKMPKEYIARITDNLKFAKTI